MFTFCKKIFLQFGGSEEDFHFIEMLWCNKSHGWWETDFTVGEAVERSLQCQQCYLHRLLHSRATASLNNSQRMDETIKLEYIL